MDERDGRARRRSALGALLLNPASSGGVALVAAAGRQGRGRSLRLVGGAERFAVLRPPGGAAGGWARAHRRSLRFGDPCQRERHLGAVGIDVPKPFDRPLAGGQFSLAA